MVSGETKVKLSRAIKNKVKTVKVSIKFISVTVVLSKV